ATVPGGQEVVRGAAAHVEPERAAVLPAVDRIAARDLHAERAGGALHAYYVAQPRDCRVELVELSAGDRAVDDDRDLVGHRVNRPTRWRGCVPCWPTPRWRWPTALSCG